MPTELTVACSYVGTCSRRNPTTFRIPAFGARYCANCDSYYCSEHFHNRPTGRRNQYCNYHQIYEAACVLVSDCSECWFHHCVNNGYECPAVYAARERSQRENSFDRSTFRNVELTFESDKVHELAMGERFVGFEIEAERGGRFTLPSKFGIVADGSLEYGGVEVLTPPSRHAALVRNTKLAMRELKKAKYKATDSCGLHMHIDLRDKKSDMRYLSRLFTLGFAVEDVLFNLQKTDRHRGTFAKPLRSKFAMFAARGAVAPDFEYIYNNMQKDRYGHGRRELRQLRGTKWGNRYLGFNFHSVFHRGTLEIRIHEGTLEPKRILNWADLIQSLAKKAEDRISFHKLIDYMAVTNREEKIEKTAKLLDLNDTLVNYMAAYYRSPRDQVYLDYGLTAPPYDAYDDDEY